MLRALPFLSYEAGGKVAVGVQASDYISSLDSPVLFVAIAGTSRSGKSFLANQVLGRMDGFDVKAGINACTRGVCDPVCTSLQLSFSQWHLPAYEYVRLVVRTRTLTMTHHYDSSL